MIWRASWAMGSFLPLPLYPSFFGKVLVICVGIQNPCAWSLQFSQWSKSEKALQPQPLPVALPSFSLEGMLHLLLRQACHVCLCMLKDENRGDAHVPSPEAAAKSLWPTLSPLFSASLPVWPSHGECERVHTFLLFSRLLVKYLGSEVFGKKKVKITYC